MSTDPNTHSPSDYQDDRPRPPDGTLGAGYAAPAFPARTVPPLPPMPSHPPVFPAAAVPPGPLDPVHPEPGAPLLPEEPSPLHGTGPVTGTGTSTVTGVGGPERPRPAQEPVPVRTPAGKPRAPQAGAAAPTPWPDTADHPAPAGAPDERRELIAAPVDKPGPVRSTVYAWRLATAAVKDPLTEDAAAKDVADVPTPVRDAIEDPSPLRKETPVQSPTAAPAPGAGGDQPAGDAARSCAADPAEEQAPNDSEQPIHTLLWTAATERPVAEVAALVSRLKRTGEVDSPGDLALRAAAVSRPLEEVRQLVALLNEYPHPLHEADTTLRAAAVGRPIEDVVQLVNMIGTDASEWRSAANEAAADDDPSPPAGQDAARQEAPAAPQTPAAHTQPSKKTPWPMAALNGALAAGPDGHTVSPAMRSGLRWPAAAVLFACGLIHLPTDVAGLRSGGYAETLSIAVTVLCLIVAVWLAVRDTALVWAAAAGLAVGVAALHALAGVGTMNLLQSSLGDSFGWARAVAVLCAGACAFLAGSVLLRRQPATGATPNS
ncbi:hypothetical protein ABZY06_23655 [Streptomyces sp. NPDC006540]|uniref:hypothetical protein n=1 Tax=Streptomyces sp. NPDC006540 TaxID=3155353 RepID=UPI0033BDC6FF